LKREGLKLRLRLSSSHHLDAALCRFGTRNREPLNVVLTPDCHMAVSKRTCSWRAPLSILPLARYTGGDATLNAEILRLFDTRRANSSRGFTAFWKARDAKSWKVVTHT